MKLCDLTVTQYLALSQAWSWAVSLAVAAITALAVWTWRNYSTRRAMERLRNLACACNLHVSGQLRHVCHNVDQQANCSACVEGLRRGRVVGFEEPCE